MPMNRSNTKTFTRRLFAGMIETVTILKRNNDQQQGTVTAYTLFNVRNGPKVKTKEPIQRDMSADYRTTFHVPTIELHRVGIHYINAADRFVKKDGSYWQPESDTTITVKMLDNEIDIDCVRVDPPAA